MKTAKLYFNKNNNFITIKLADVLEEYYEKANKNSKFEHVSLTKEGVVPKTERYNRDFLVKDTNKLYRVTHLNDICYNPANLKFGVICRNTYKDGIFSPIYITFKVSEKVLPNYIEYLITREEFINRTLKYQQGTVFERMSVSPIDLCSIEINIPNIEEQQKISTFLSAFDLKIGYESQIIEQLKQLKKSLLYKMFPTENSNVPELRFKGFTETWEQRKLKDFTERIIEKNKNLDTLLPLTISTQYGLISQTEFFNKQIASKNLSNYYLLKKGDFAYNKSYSGEAPWGSIKRLDKYEKGALSTLYIAFKIKNINQIDSEFLNTFYKTNKWYTDIQNIATEGARNHGLLNISSNDFFETFIKIPNIKEQEKIGELFLKLDSLITLHQYMYNKLFQVKNNIFSRYSAYYSNILHNFLPIIFTYAQPQYKSHTKKYIRSKNTPIIPNIFSLK